MNFFFRYIHNNKVLLEKSGIEMDGEKARILSEKHPTKESADKMDPNSNDDDKIANSSKIKPKKRSSASANDDKNDGDGPALSYTKKESIDKKIKNIENPASTSQSQIKTSHRSNFLHRLLACGGSCTGRRRTSNSTQNIKKPLNDHIGMRKPSIELSVFFFGLYKILIILIEKKLNYLAIITKIVKTKFNLSFYH